MKYNDLFFYFEPYIHINFGQPNSVLIYNVSTSRERVIKNSLFFSKVKQLISEYEFGFYIDQEELYEICLSLKEDLLGEIIDIKDGKLPFLIPPSFFKVEKNRGYFSKLEIRDYRSNIFDYIFHLDFFIGIDFSESNKMFPHIYANKIINKICFDDWINYVKDYKIRTNLQSINIYIANHNNDNFLFIKQLNELLGLKYINLHLPYNISNNYKGNYKKILYFPCNEIENKKTINTFFSKILKSDYIIFLVESEKQFSIVEEMAIDKTLKNYNFYPHYNGNNYDFFHSNIFIEHTNLFEEKPSMDTLFRNSQLNSNDFGRILIDSSGYYKTNIFGNTIGHIKNDDLQKSIHNCITNAHSSWFQTRNCVAPCSECIYNHVCPPISNYERALNKMDLCWKSSSHNNISSIFENLT